MLGLLCSERKSSAVLPQLYSKSHRAEELDSKPGEVIWVLSFPTLDSEKNGKCYMTTYASLWKGNILEKQKDLHWTVWWRGIRVTKIPEILVVTWTLPLNIKKPQCPPVSFFFLPSHWKHISMIYCIHRIICYQLRITSVFLYWLTLKAA